MWVVLARVDVLPERRQAFLDAVEEAVRETELRNPRVVIRVDVTSDKDDPNRLYFHEVYADCAAFEEHQQDPSYQAFSARVREWFADAPVVLGMGESVLQLAPLRTLRITPAAQGSGQSDGSINHDHYFAEGWSAARDRGEE